MRYSLCQQRDPTSHGPKRVSCSCGYYSPAAGPTSLEMYASDHDRLHRLKGDERVDVVLVSERNVQRHLSGDDVRPGWAALAEVFSDIAEIPEILLSALLSIENEIMDKVRAHKEDGTLDWTGEALILRFPAETVTLWPEAK